MWYYIIVYIVLWFMMFKYFILLPIIAFNCILYAESESSQEAKPENSEKLENIYKDSNNKSKDKKSDNNEEKTNKKKCSKEKDENNIICKRKQLIELSNFLNNLTKSNNSKDIDVKRINSIIANVNNTQKMLDDITNKKYNNKNSLKIQVQKFNKNVEEITKQYKDLFKLPDQEDKNNQNSDKNNSLPVINNGKIQSMTSLNWNKDTRNNSNVITNPLDVSSDELNNIRPDGEIINPECMVIDLSRPLTMSQVEEYYNRKSDNDVPVHETIPIGKSYDDSNISNKITDKNI